MQKQQSTEQTGKERRNLMRVGSRFSIGATPKGLPVTLVAEMARVEKNLSPIQRESLRWTLTWLEDRPILTLDNGIVLGS